jgi:hypothetical protein
MSMVLNNLSQINPVLYYIIDNNFAQFTFLYFNLLGTGHLTFMGGGTLFGRLNNNKKKKWSKNNKSIYLKDTKNK